VTFDIDLTVVKRIEGWRAFCAEYGISADATIKMLAQIYDATQGASGLVHAVSGPRYMQKEGVCDVVAR
jgi:hypothetical protein